MTRSTDYTEVGFAVIGDTATLELRRPDKRNAVTASMWQAIIEHLDTAADRQDIRVLIVRGAGGTFCAGADLDAVKQADGSPSAAFHALAVQALAGIAAFPVPSVALIQGACIGGGCSLALACDLRFAHPGAVFGIPAVRHGIVYDAGSIARLRELTGPGNAARLLYTAARIDAAEALRIGLVDACVEDYDSVVSEFAHQVSLGTRPAIAAHRQLLRAPFGLPAGLPAEGSAVGPDQRPRVATR